MSGFVDEAVDAVEDIFPHKPGGIIDRERQNRANREAAEQDRLNSSQRVEERSVKSVKVAQISPEVFSPQTFTIQPGGYAPVLNLNPYRHRTTILVITSNATVVLAKDQGAAISAIGFTLPFGVPLPLYGRGQLYAFNNTGATVQVSVISENYGPEQ